MQLQLQDYIVCDAEICFVFFTVLFSNYVQKTYIHIKG